MVNKLDELLSRIQKEKEMRSQIPMFGGTSIDAMNNSYNIHLE